MIGKGYKGGLVPVPGSASLDSRIIVRGSSPYPATIGGIVF